jgi:hypothetical protein
MLMAKKNTARSMTSPIPSHVNSPPARQKSLPNVPHIQTTFSPQYSPMQAQNAQSAILSLERKIDPSTAVDVFSREPKVSDTDGCLYLGPWVCEYAKLTALVRAYRNVVYNYQQLLVLSSFAITLRCFPLMAMALHQL